MNCFETPNECMGRIRTMASADPTWDLSDNDLYALNSLLAKHDALVAALEEVRDHLYTKQDMERCREMAKEALK